MQTVIMPKMGDAMEEGTLVRWLKQEGEMVKAGEPIAEIATDKATIELEAPASGILRGIRVQEGATVPINTPLAYILAEGESLPAELDRDGKPAEAPSPVPPSSVGVPPTIAPSPVPSPPVGERAETPLAPSGGEGQGVRAERILASPLARKIAREHGIDLRLLKGTGPQGRIVERDVLAYLQQRAAQPAAVAPAPAPIAARTESLNRLRQITAQRTTEAKQTIPHFYLTIEIDMEEALALRETLNRLEEGVRVSVNDLVLKACAVAIEKHPLVNASYRDGTLVYADGIHIGIAVAVDEGLLVAVVRHCESKPLLRIAQEAQALIQKAREGKLLPDEMTGNTFTVSNLGMFDIDEFAAIINPPASAILAVGAVKKVPVVMDDGSIQPRSRMKVTLSCDHRVLDGATGARFLQELKRVLENPVLIGYR